MSLARELNRYLERVTDEYQRLQIIDGIERQAAATSRVAASMEAAEASVAFIESGVARLAAVADHAVPVIVDHLGLTAERLGNIEQILSSPTENAAAELYRRGSFALASGWLEEAASDLAKAVEAFPYHSKPWFNLGIALVSRYWRGRATPLRGFILSPSATLRVAGLAPRVKVEHPTV